LLPLATANCAEKSATHAASVQRHPALLLHWVITQFTRFSDLVTEITEFSLLNLQMLGLVTRKLSYRKDGRAMRPIWVP